MPNSKPTLIGQTFVLSTQNKKTGFTDLRKIRVIRVFTENNLRMYEAQDINNGSIIHAHADVYDRLFLVTRSQVKAKGAKGEIIYNTSHPNYRR